MADLSAITDRHDAEEEIRAAVEKALTRLDGTDGNFLALPEDLQRWLGQALYEQLPPLYICDAEGDLLYANRPFFQLIVRGAGNLEAARHIREETRRDVRRARDYLDRGERPPHLHRASGAEGDQRHWSLRHFPLQDTENRVIAVGGFFLEITDQVAAIERVRGHQERFNDVVRSASDWVWETDAEGRISWISERITEVLGEPAGFMVGRLLPGLDPLAPSSGHDGLARAFSRRAPFRDVRVELIDRAGQRRPHHLSGVPVFDEDSGRLTGFRGTSTDISAREAAEKAARQSRDELEHAVEALHHKNIQLDIALMEARQAARAKSEFLANMSHELRTPLNAVLGYSEMMVQRMFGEIPDRYGEYAQLIHRAGHHLLQLISDILELTRIEAGGIELEPQSLDLGDVIGDALALVSLKAAEKKIDLSAARLEAGLAVQADPTRLMQILVNLLGNAVKFTPEGGAIGAELEPAEAGHVRFVIWDTGPGIDEELIERVFDRFFQKKADPYRRNGAEQGVGLGLTIARQLARLMGGELSYAHRAGGGSRFRVRLPLAEGARAAAPTPLRASGGD